MMELEATQEISITDYKQSDEEDNDRKQNIVAHLKLSAQKGMMETVYPIYEGENLIGRDPDACDIHLAAKALSKQHACIEVKGENHLIYDKGSRNKTKKGKLYLKPDVRYNLEDGDQITFADIKCTYTYMKTEVKSDDDSNLVESPQKTSVNNNERQEDSICYELDEEEMSSDVIDPTQDVILLGSFCHPSQPTQLYVADSEPEENQSEPSNEISHSIPDSDDEPELGSNCSGLKQNAAVTSETNQMPKNDPASSSVSQENDESGPAKMPATTLPELCKDTVDREAYNLDLCPTQTAEAIVEPTREQQADLVPDSQSQMVTQTFDGNRPDEVDTDTQTFKDKMSDSQIVMEIVGDSTLGYGYTLEEDVSEGAVKEQCTETSTASYDAKDDQSEASTPDSETIQSVNQNTEDHKQSDVGQKIRGDAVRSQVLTEKEAKQISEDKVDVQHSETGLTQLFKEDDEVCEEADLTQTCENEYDEQTCEKKNMAEVCEEKGDIEVLIECEVVQVCENKLNAQVVTESETAHNLGENVDKMTSKEVQNVYVYKEKEEKNVVGFDDLPKIVPPTDGSDTQHLSDVVPQTQVTEELGSQRSPKADGTLIVAETPSDTAIHVSYTRMDPEQSPSRQHSSGNDPTKMSSELSDTVLLVKEDVDRSESQCDTTLNMDTSDVPTLYVTSPATELNLHSPLRNSTLDATQILDYTQSGVCVPSPVLRVTSPLSVPDRRRPSSPQDDLEETQILDASGNESSVSSMPRCIQKKLTISVMNEDSNENANDELPDICGDFSTIQDNEVANTQAYSEQMDDDTDTKEQSVNLRSINAEERIATNENESSTNVCRNEKEEKARSTEEVNQASEEKVEESLETTPVKSSCRQRRKKSKGSKTAGQDKVKGQKLIELTTQAEEEDMPKQQNSHLPENTKNRDEESLDHVKDQSFDTEDDHMASTQAYSDDKDDSKPPVKGMKTRRRQNKLEQKADADVHKTKNERRSTRSSKNISLMLETEDVIQPESVTVQQKSESKGKFQTVGQRNTRSQRLAKHTAQDLENNLAIQQETKKHDRVLSQSSEIDDDHLASTQAYDEQMDGGSELPVRGLKTRRSKTKFEQKAKRDVCGRENEKNSQRSENEKDETTPLRFSCRQTRKKGEGSKTAWQGKVKGQKITEQTRQAGKNDISQDINKQDDDNVSENYRHEDKPEAMDHVNGQSFDVDDDQMASTQAYGEQTGSMKGGSEHPVTRIKTRRQNKLQQKDVQNVYKEKEASSTTIPERSSSRQTLTKDKSNKIARPYKAKGLRITEQTTQAEGNENFGHEDENKSTDQSFDVDDDQMASTQAYDEHNDDKKDGSERPVRGRKMRRQIKLEKIAGGDVCEEEKEKKERRLPKKINKTPKKEHEQNPDADIPVKIGPNKTGSKDKRIKTEKKVKKSDQGSDVHHIAYDEPANKDVTVVLEKINLSPEDTPVLVSEELSFEQQTHRSVKLTKLRLKKNKKQDSEENGMSSDESQAKNIYVSGVRGSSQTMENGGIAVIPEKQASEKKASCVKVKVENETPTAVTCFGQSSVSIKPDPDECSDYSKTPPRRRSRKRPLVLGTITDSKYSKKLSGNIASQSTRTNQPTNAIVKIEMMEADVDEDFEPASCSQVRRSLRRYAIKQEALCTPTKQAKFDGSVKRSTQTSVSGTEVHACVNGTIRRQQQSNKKSEIENLPRVPQEGDDELSSTSKAKLRQRSHQQKQTQKTKTELSESDGSPKNKKRKLSSKSPATPRRSHTSSVGSPSLRKSASEAKPKVMFTGLSTKQAEKTVKNLGGSLASSIQDCTHLVTDKVRRTMKFLCALARGIPIVSPAWLDSCRAAGLFLDASSFLVVDKASEKTYKFSLASSLKAAAKHRMLTGYKIHVTKSVVPDAEQMKDIITCAGGEFLPTMPKKAGDKIIVISCPEDKALYKTAKGKHIAIVTAEFMLTGILQQVVDVKTHSL